MGKKLFVGRLSYSTTDATLREGFEPYGTVVEARVIFDRNTGESRLFGFVTFDTDEAAAEAMEKMNGAMLDGRTIRVNEAEERGRGGGGPGGGGGRGRGGPGGGGNRRHGNASAPEVHTRGRSGYRTRNEGGDWKRPGYRPGSDQGGGPGGGPGGDRGPGRGGPPRGDRGGPPRGGPPRGGPGRGGPPRGGPPRGGPPRGDRGGPPRGGGGGGFQSETPGFGEPDKNDWGADRQQRRTEDHKAKKKTKRRAEEGDFGAPRSTPKKDRRSSGRSWRDYTTDGEDFDEEF